MADFVYAPRGSNDREDFIEDKIQLVELINRGLEVDILEKDMDVTGKIVVGHGIGRRGLKGDPLWPLKSEKVYNYHNAQTFRDFAKRKFIITPFTIEDIERAAKNIGGTVLVKFAGAQKITAIFEIDTTKDIRAQIIDKCGWEMVRVGGDDRSVIVQEKITMHYEYRIFVIDGFPVTGAGCIEIMTPLENERLFDPKMEGKRSNGNIEYLPYHANQFKQYAENLICPSFVKEGIKDYTLDLFMTFNGDVGIVEINPAYQAGFYALDYSALFSAILEKQK